GRDDRGLAALHDGDDRVGRPEVDADDLAHWCGDSCPAQWLGWFGCVLIDSICWLRRRLAAVLRDGDPRGPADPVRHAVTATELVDDLAAGPAGAGHVGNGLVLVRVEPGSRSGLDGAHALALQELSQLPVDRGDALDPGLVDAALGPVLHREVEVIGERE